MSLAMWESSVCVCVYVLGSGSGSGSGWLAALRSGVAAGNGALACGQGTMLRGVWQCV